MKQKRKLGRPTTLTPAKEVQLLKLVSQGKNFREACRALRLGYDVVWDRRAADPDFYDRSARAARLGTEANLEQAEARLKRSTNKRISVDRELAHHYRWKASKLLSAYKDRVGIDVQADGPVRATKLPRLEMARLFLFAIHEGSRNAPLPNFIEAVVYTLNLIAGAVRSRGEAKFDARLADVADGIGQVAKIVERRLVETQPALPAPKAEPSGVQDTARGPLDNVRPLKPAQEGQSKRGSSYSGSPGEWREV